MDQTRIQKYQPGGEYYQSIAAQFGTNAANTLAAAASTGDQTHFNDVYEQIKGNGTAQDSSTFDNLISQLYNDPFSAPIEQATVVAKNTVTSAGNAASSVAKTALGNVGIWIIGAALLIAAFFYFGGAAVIRRRVSNA